MLFRVAQRKYEAKQTQIIFEVMGLGGQALHTGGSCREVRRWGWGSQATAVGGAGRWVRGSFRELWTAFSQRMGFYEWLESPHLFLVVEGTSEIMEFKCPSFRRRNGDHGKMQLVGGSQPSYWSILNLTQLAGYRWVLFAEATDWTTTGLAILVRDS